MTTVRFDRSARSVVACCPCGARDVFSHQTFADQWARDHIAAVHPDKTTALSASMDKRHARGITA